MGFMDFLNKVREKNNIRNQDSNREPKKVMTPDELELYSYKERERKEKVKAELDKYRLKDTNDFIFGRDENKRKTYILQSKNVFKR